MNNDQSVTISKKDYAALLAHGKMMERKIASLEYKLLPWYRRVYLSYCAFFELAP